MKFETHGIGLHDEQMDAAREGLRKVGAPTRGTVVVTDRFAADVALATGNRAYSADRGAGVVAARTITDASGAPAIFVNAPELRRRDAYEVERLLAHEGGHALLNARGEGPVGRRHLVSSTWQWEMLCLGALALDEARIETLLRRLQYPPTGSISQEHLEDSLFVLNIDVAFALIDSGDDVQLLQERIIVAQDHFTKILAYLAPYEGHSGAARRGRLSAVGRRHWDDYVGVLWEQRRSVYDECPDASEALNAAQLDEAYMRTFDLEVAQLRRLGFERAGSDAEETFIRVATDLLCQVRVDAAMREHNSRQ